MKRIEIFFDDLSADKQKEILKTVGTEYQYDAFPVAEVTIFEE